MSDSQLKGMSQKSRVISMHFAVETQMRYVNCQMSGYNRWAFLPPACRTKQTDWTQVTLRRYLSPMFKRDAEIERRIRSRAIEGGRERFIRRRLLEGFVTWFAWAVLMFLFKVLLYSAHEVVSISLIALPLWILAAYLGGRRRWNDMVKKQLT